MRAGTCSLVGRTPWSAADAPVGLFALGMMLGSLLRRRDEGVPRGPGGPPHQSDEVVFRPCVCSISPPSQDPVRRRKQLNQATSPSARCSPLTSALPGLLVPGQLGAQLPNQFPVLAGEWQVQRPATGLDRIVRAAHLAVDGA